VHEDQALSAQLLTLQLASGRWQGLYGFGKDHRSDRSAYERTENFSIPLTSGSKLELRNSNGRIAIAGADIEECRVVAKVRVKVPDVVKAKELAEKVNINIAPSAGKLFVAVDRSEVPKRYEVTVDFDIVARKQLDLLVQNNNGPIAVTNLSGQLDASTNNGAVTAFRVAGSLRLHTNNGKIIVIGSALTHGKFDVNNGQITCSRVSGDLDLKVGNGQADVSYAADAPGALNLEIKVDNGNIRFTPPADLSAVVEATTEIGSIASDLPLTGKGSLGKIAKGTIGKGEGKVRLETNIGSITIKKGSVQPAPVLYDDQ